MNLHEKEKMYQKTHYFKTLLICMVIYYFEKIVDFLAWIGSKLCLPFLFGAGLAFCV